MAVREHQLAEVVLAEAYRNYDLPVSSAPQITSSVDATERPLLRVRIGEVPSLGELEEVFAKLRKELERGGSICMLVDATATKTLELDQVRLIADFGEDNHDLVSSRVMALAFVVPSAMVRGALKVAFRLKPPPHPVSVFKVADDAQSYLQPFLRNKTQD
uniref:STAS domain-containing protein n=1 Tax=Pseudenhygromyxa salsuginis TaxID=442868 RepID=A0A3S7UWQ0_9BACT|nr:hypothetical protein [Pseudenhygromyxa salsuginis]